jgi:hypothetical protein
MNASRVCRSSAKANTYQVPALREAAFLFLHWESHHQCHPFVLLRNVSVHLII